MKKVIFATLLTAVAVMAQGTGGNAPAGSKATPAPAAAPAATDTTKTPVKKHSRVKKNAKPAAAVTTPGATKAPAAAPAGTPAAK